MIQVWYYFGCGSGPGHYLYPEGQAGTRGFGRPLMERLTKFDGELAPWPERQEYLYHAAFFHLGGLGYRGLAWWDRSVDERPASNSIIFAPSLTIEAAEILEEGRRRFPWVFARTPEPVQLWPLSIR